LTNSLNFAIYNVSKIKKAKEFANFTKNLQKTL